MAYETFENALLTYHKLETAAVEARIAYEFVYAQALVDADGGSSEKRKAQAEIVASPAHREAELAAIEAKVAAHMVYHLRADVRAQSAA